MKTVWVLILTLAVLLVVPFDVSEGSRRRNVGSALRRRQLSAAYSRGGHQHPRRSLPPMPPPRCHSDVTRPEAEDEYEAKIKAAPFVFTGKVIHIVEHGRDLTSLQVDADGVDFDNREKVFEVRLKRALKGDFPWSLLEVELSKPHLHKTVEVVVNGRASDGVRGTLDGAETTTVASHHLREPRCRHVLRQNHTAIFLARRRDGGRSSTFRLELAANPLALTLRNLNKVTAAAKDIPYKAVPPIIEEPCEKQYCSFGASCIADADGRARCQCPTDCPDVFAPVCGTDGNTYDNHCLLRKKSCHEETNVRVQHSGECGAVSTVSSRRA